MDVIRETLEEKFPAERRLALSKTKDGRWLAEELSHSLTDSGKDHYWCDSWHYGSTPEEAITLLEKMNDRPDGDELDQKNLM